MVDLSICIVTRNRDRSCGRVLTEIKRQVKISKLECEIVIVVDEKDFGRYRQVMYSSEGNEKWVLNNSDGGLARGRNRAIYESSGEWVLFCDDDDLWKDDFLEDMTRELRRESRSIIARLGINLEYLGEARRELGELTDIKSLMYRGATPPESAQMYRREMLCGLPGYNERIKSGVDHDLWIRIGCRATGKVRLIGVQRHEQCEVQGRMTSAGRSRESGVRDALAEWKVELEQSFGSSFYRRIEKKYEEYFTTVAVIGLVKGRDLKGIMRLAKRKYKLRSIAGMVAARLRPSMFRF